MKKFFMYLGILSVVAVLGFCGITGILALKDKVSFGDEITSWFKSAEDKQETENTTDEVEPVVLIVE